MHFSRLSIIYYRDNTAFIYFHSIFTYKIIFIKIQLFQKSFYSILLLQMQVYQLLVRCYYSDFLFLGKNPLVYLENSLIFVSRQTMDFYRASRRIQKLFCDEQSFGRAIFKSDCITQRVAFGLQVVSRGAPYGIRLIVINPLALYFLLH